MVELNDIKIFIDPSYEVFYNNVIFDANSKYNRDNQFTPLIYLKEFLNSKGYKIYTADYLLNGKEIAKVNIYFSFGILKNYTRLLKRSNVILSSFFITEPFVVYPGIYQKIKKISRYFKRIFTHSGCDGLENYIDNSNKILKFYIPQTENNILENLWQNNERKFLASISANKKPNYYYNELYSERIKAIKFFAEHGEIDLYGFGWDKINLFFPYLLNRKIILKVYKGSVKSKYEILSKYKFAICFENSIQWGYVTEKIFDCFFVGTIPIYWGAPDVKKFIPENCFINMIDFKNYNKLRNYLKSLTKSNIETFRENARKYLLSHSFKPFTKEYFADMFFNIIKEDIKR